MQIVVPDVEALTDAQLGLLRSAKGKAGVDTPLDVVSVGEATDWCTVGAFGAPGGWGLDDLARAVATEGRHESLRAELSGRDDILWLDTETRSRVDLKRATPYRYATCPDFQVLMSTYARGDEPVSVTFGPDIPGLTDPDVLKVAWNANFDRVILSAALGMPQGEYLDPREWVDAASLFGLYGYPRSLKDAAIAVGADPKDEAGTRLINLFSRPNRKGGWSAPEDYPEDWDAFVRYGLQDVDTMRDAMKRLGLGFPTPVEREASVVDQVINDRGVRVDLALAAEAVRSMSDFREDALGRIKEVTGLANPNSRNQLLGWLNERGCGVEDVTKATVEALLERDTPEDVREVLLLRQETALTAASKFEAMQRIALDDSRARGVLVYTGAHTGRWASTKFQIHNLPRASFTKIDENGKEVWDEEAENAAIDALHHGAVLDPSDLKKLIRASMIGPFTVQDYSAIEARVLAWLAGEQWTLDAFADDRDIYVETAKMLDPSGGSMTRSHGKVTVLACGYGGGGHAMLKMGGRSLVPGQENMLDDEVARELYPIAEKWRAANPRVVQFWTDLERAFAYGGKAGRIDVEVVGCDRWAWLPSGRPLVYHNVRQEWFTTPKGRAKHAWHFDNPGEDRKRIPRVETYGGKLSENCVSGDMEVLTDTRGWVPLRDVRHTDAAWDGVEFVNHSGVHYSGRHHTVSVSGVRMTPDHLVLTTEGWMYGAEAEGYCGAAVRLPTGAPEE